MAIFALALGLGGAGGAVAETAPVLCFDEAHRNVHLAGRTYAPFVKLAEGVGFSLKVSESTWSPDSLASCTVLVTAGPRGAGRDRPLSERGRPAYAYEEVRAVADWVTAGGGLLLITDHAPIGAAASPLATWLGVDMSNAFTEDPEHAGSEPGELVFSRENGLLGSHPVTEGRSPAERIDRVSTYLGQSLAGPEGSVSLLTLGPAAKDRRRAGDDRTWADPSPNDPLTPAAGRSQGLAMTVEAGRVAVFGEAAIFTAQGLAEGPAAHANAQLALNLLRWLAGQFEADAAPGPGARSTAPPGSG